MGEHEFCTVSTEPLPAREGLWSKTISVDFDGVIHKYRHGWCDGAIYDEPVEGAIEALITLQHCGYNVIVLTARASVAEVVDWLHVHFAALHATHLIPAVTNIKQPARVYIDDRAVRFTNWPDMIKLLL